MDGIKGFNGIDIYAAMGIVGAIVFRIRRYLIGRNYSVKKFTAFLFIAVLVSIGVGVLLKELTSFSNTVIYVACGVTGVFSKYILDEVQELISEGTNIVKSKFGGRYRLSSTKPKKDIPQLPREEGTGDAED